MAALCSEIVSTQSSDTTHNRLVSEKCLDPIMACHGEKIWELKSAVTDAEMFCEMAKEGIVVGGSSVLRATLVYR
jgi:hypothetical protein